MLSSLLFISAVFLQAVPDAPDLFTQPLLENAYNEITPAIVLLRYSSEVTNPASGEVNKRDGNALGLIVSPDGLIMTHGHLVKENSHPFRVTAFIGQDENEKLYDATVLKKPNDLNVVFLRIENEEKRQFPYVKFTSAPTLAVGKAIAIFGILSEELDYVRGVQETRISAILEKPRTTYCIDTAMRFGYVGGPVIDTRGQIIGVIGYDLSTAEGGDIYVRSGHPLLYQSQLFQKYIDTPPNEDDVDTATSYAWLGVFTQPLKDEYAEYWDLEAKGGLIVSTVVPGSPAAEVGLQPGDIIQEFNGIPIRAKQDRDVIGFTKLVRETGAENKVSIKLLRNGVPQEIYVQLGVRPITSRDADEYEDPLFGLTVREITTDIRIALNLAEDVKGVIIRRVRSGSAAQIAKMRPGVIIMNFGDHPVTNIADFKAAIEKLRQDKPAEIPVFARVGPATGFFRLQPRWE